MAEEELRFSSKKEYELEIAKVLNQLNAARKSRDSGSAKAVKRLERQYDELVEEYMRFCSLSDKKDG